MAYIVNDIKIAKAQSGFRYLFDANIWLAVLDSTFYTYQYQPYIKLFNSIINENDVRDASIVIPSLLLSEIINKIINRIYYEEFKLNHPLFPNQSKHDHFKNSYRVSQQYSNDLENVCASIRDYHMKIEFVSDELDQYSCKDLIKKIPSHLDINDYIYSKMALSQGLVIVTNDSDFKVEDIHIVTSRPTLLALQNKNSN